MRDAFRRQEQAIVDRLVKQAQDTGATLTSSEPTGTVVYRPEPLPLPEPQVVEARVIRRAEPDTEPDPLPSPRLRRERNPDAATARRNNLRALWYQLSRVLPASLLASAALGLLVGVLTGTRWWGVAAAVVPVVLYILWMIGWTRQAIAHQRGEAMPPPGWAGTLGL